MIILDKKSLEILFNENYEILCNVANTFVNDTDFAEDIVQEVFVNLWHNKEKLLINSSLKNYLFSAVRNKSIEKLRRKKLEDKYIKSELEKADSHIDEADESEKNEKIAKMITAVENLPEKCKMIFKMAKMDGMTYKEIADELDLSVKTIESQMRRAFILLKEALVGE
ncbi:MAG: RNA polymerase sigma-70 factor [Saprospiraceae bacterium]